MAIIRMDKFLAAALQLSRSDVKKILRRGNLLCGGMVCKDAGFHVDTERDLVVLDGKTVQYSEFCYIMLNKPAGVVSASQDSREKTVVDLVPPEMKRKGLFPAGRLDKDSTGFVLLTDDGAFAHNILAPGKHIPKVYLVTLERAVTDAEKQTLLAGPELDGERLLPVRTEEYDSARLIYSVTLQEGRYHQIKRMFAAQGNHVIGLHRIKMGGLELDPALLPGQCKVLSEEDINLLTQNACYSGQVF